MTFTALVKLYSTVNIFCNTTVAGLGEIFIQWKFSVIQYSIYSSCKHSLLCLKLQTYCSHMKGGHGCLVHFTLGSNGGHNWASPT